MVFRIGINVVDIIQSDDAIYGDGVNIAARIEGWSSRAASCCVKRRCVHLEYASSYIMVRVSCNHFVRFIKITSMETK